MNAVELGIKTKRVVQKGIKCYKILDFSCYNIDDDELPIKYFNEFPYCFEECDQLVIVTNDKGLPKCDCEEFNGLYHFGVDDYIDKDTFEKALEIIKVCGHKLHTINQEIKEMKKEWFGEEEFKI